MDSLAIINRTPDLFVLNGRAGNKGRGRVVLSRRWRHADASGDFIRYLCHQGFAPAVEPQPGKQNRPPEQLP